MARRTVPLVLGVLCVLVQLYGLYAPAQPGGTGGLLGLPGADKAAHLGMFLLPALFLRVAGLPWAALAGIFGAHAVVSEVIQGTLLPHRSMDPLDVAADLLGLALGLLLGGGVLRRRPVRPRR